MLDVLVIGGGIAGLAAAFKLAGQGLDVRVLEAKHVAGGNVRTITQDNYRLELGPYSFMASSEYMWRLVEELDFESQAEASSAAADNRYIYRDGRLLPLPLGLGQFFTSPLLSVRAKLRLMAEPFIPSGAKDDDTAWEFFVRRFGKEAATYVMGPFVSGIYAGNPKLLGARAAFPKFHAFEAESGSMIRGSMKFMIAKRRRMRREGLKVRKGLFSFFGGLGAITDQLIQHLGERVVTDASVKELERLADGYKVHTESGSYTARVLVCAVPPDQAAGLLAQLVAGVREPLNATPMSPVTLVHWSQPSKGRELPAGFGFLMPRIYDLRVLGTIFASQLFSNRAPQDVAAFSSYYGGMLDQGAMELADDQLFTLLLKEHSRIFGMELEEPPMVRILRYPGAIPQLTPDHPERITAVRRELAAFPGVCLAGNYLTGVGIEHAVQSGYLAAEEAAQQLHSLAKATVEASA